MNEDQIATARESNRIVQFYETINRISNELNIDYFDHTYLHEISNNPYLFRNANHLNNNGSL